MSTKSPNIGLTLTSSSEGTKAFRDWVDENTSDTPESNLMKIDTAIKNAQDSVAAQEKSLSNHAGDLTKHVSTSEKSAWNGKAEKVHKHEIADVNGLSAQVDTLAKKDLSNIDNAEFKTKAETAGVTTTWNNLQGKPATFPPSTHKHPTTDVTGLDTELAGKAAAVHTHNTADVTGLDAALQSVRKEIEGKADLKDGKVPESQLPSYIPLSNKGTSGGVAELDSSGRVPAAQLPSYVDDVLEYAGLSAFPKPGETGKIYVDTATNLTYRWSGSAYVEISPSLALGETAATAYRGDRGKSAYDHISDGIKHITAAERTSWNAKETPSGAQAKADAALKTAREELAALSEKMVVDAALSATSTNPVQNKAVKSGIDAVQANLNSHTGNKANPHGVTAEQAGAATKDLSNVSEADFQAAAKDAGLPTMESLSGITVGKTWNASTMPIAASWNQPVFANGIWVTCSRSSTAAAWSTDGKTWISATLPSSASWNQPVFANGVWVTCGSSSSDAAVWSTDGKTWTASTLPASASWNQPVFANGVWVTCGISAITTAAWSEDGKTWTASTLPSSASWTQPVYANDIWVACGNKGAAVYSTDGKTWTASTLPAIARLNQPVFANGIWVTCSSNSASRAAVWSTDGKTWTASTLPASASWSQPVFANGVWVTCGGINGGDAATWSTDGKTWTAATMPESASWSQPVFANGIWVTCGSGNSTSAAYSERTQYIDAFTVEGQRLIPITKEEIDAICI